MPRRLQLRDDLGLSVGPDLGADLVDAKLTRDRVGDATRIARDEQRPQAPSPQLGDRVTGRGLRRVREREDAGRFSIDGANENGAALFLMVREDVVTELREAVRPSEVRIADPDVVPVDRRVDALTGKRLERGGLGERDPFRGRELDNGSGERMLRS